MNRVMLNSFADELDKMNMEKKAIGPLTIGGLGLLSHVGANIATKALHKPLAGVRARGMAKGIQQAIEGKPRGLKSRFIETWVGPEHTVTEEAGRALGQQLRNLPMGSRYRTLKKMRKVVAMSPEVAHTPILEDTVSAINKVLKRPLPAVGPEQKAGIIGKTLPFAPAPLIAAIEPAALIHGGVNVGRKMVATSKPGQKFLRTAFQKGLMEKGTPLASYIESNPELKNLATQLSADIPEGSLDVARPLSKIEQLLWDVGVSPAAQYNRIIGRDLANMLKTQEGAKRLSRMYGVMQPMLKPVMGEELSPALSMLRQSRAGSF